MMTPGARPTGSRFLEASSSELSLAHAKLVRPIGREGCVLSWPHQFCERRWVVGDMIWIGRQNMQRYCQPLRCFSDRHVVVHAVTPSASHCKPFVWEWHHDGFVFELLDKVTVTQ